MKSYQRILSGCLIAASIFSSSLAGYCCNNVCACEVNIDRDFVAVRSANELAVAVESANDGDYIVLCNDIVLNRDIEIKSSITLDLNSYNIDTGKDSYQLICGKKEFDHVENHIVNHPPEVKNVSKNVWVNGEWYIDANGVRQFRSGHWKTIWEKVVVPAWTEYCQKDVYNYNDDIIVKIKNGRIEKISIDENAKKKDDKYDSFDDTCGKNGKTYKEPLRVISGTVGLKDVNVFGCDGQNGQDGGYQKLWHVPFGGGHGGNGGNGGDGSYAIFIERKEAKVVANRKCAIKGGVGGKAGKGSKANPNYWLWSGSCGEDGKDGKNQKACNNPDRLIYV